MIVGGVFGPKKSGKTTLAKELAEQYWRKEQRRSLVNDPNLTDDWGATCWVAPSESEFWNKAWTTQNCLLICDDAGRTIDRAAELNDAFTRINHNGHKLLVIGHSGTNLTTVQRQQMDVVYLFRTTPKAAEYWYDVFGDKKILTANKLQRYEFLYIRQYEETQKMMLTL